MQMGQTPEHALEPLSAEIIVYPNRRRTWVWLLLGGVGSVLLLLGCLFALILMSVVPEARNAGAILLALLLLGMASAGLWPTRAVANLLTSREPMLVITHQGIRVGKLYGPFEIVLSWKEIAAIYPIGGGLEKQLCIRPTNVKLFLSGFGPLMRFFLRINLMNGAPIAIAQSFLDQPIAEILHVLQDQYAQELNDYQVQLRPARIQ